MTFSSAFRLAKSWTFWNVRARPSAAMRCGGQPVMSDPSKQMRPSLGVRRPEIMLNVVVLPAPLGPIIAVMAPRSRVNETCETATSPPKRMVTRSVASAAVPSVIDAPAMSRNWSDGVRDGRRRVAPRSRHALRTARRGRQLGGRCSPLASGTGPRIRGAGPECQVGRSNPRDLFDLGGFKWFRGSDLNRRPLGYEPTNRRHSTRRKPNTPDTSRQYSHRKNVGH